MVGAYVKESTRPVDFVSHSDVRAMERVEFNQQSFTIYFKITYDLYLDNFSIDEVQVQQNKTS